MRLVICKGVERTGKDKYLPSSLLGFRHTCRVQTVGWLLQGERMLRCLHHRQYLCRWKTILPILSVWWFPNRCLNKRGPDSPSALTTGTFGPQIEWLGKWASASTISSPWPISANIFRRDGEMRGEMPLSTMLTLSLRGWWLSGVRGRFCGWAQCQSWLSELWVSGESKFVGESLSRRGELATCA